MYRWELAWYEPTECLSIKGTEIIDLYHFKGFTKKESYERKLKQLERKGYRIVGKIEDGREVYRA